MKVITAGLATSSAQGNAQRSFVYQLALQIGLSIKIGTSHQPVKNFNSIKQNYELKPVIFVPLLVAAVPAPESMVQ